ncbi:MAG: hypothetical protein Q9N32_00470 [Gammaproteobacteria bacterium]|nr:hypothetical protein [Gammaproteobacteria bacterium]
MKDERQLLEKVTRKERMVEVIANLMSITDVIGLRIISLFRDDMIDPFSKNYQA